MQAQGGNQDCLEGGGEIGALMRSIDWSKTPIGAVETWSPALRTIMRMLLVNRFQLFLWWGPHYVQFYNDASWPILGAKHPRSMGQPAAECWSEIWHVIGPLIDSPFHGGPATWMEDIFLEINRYGYVEETHFTIAYSPVPDDDACPVASAGCSPPSTRSPGRWSASAAWWSSATSGRRPPKRRPPRRPAPPRPGRWRRTTRTSRSP